MTWPTTIYGKRERERERAAPAPSLPLPPHLTAGGVEAVEGKGGERRRWRKHSAVTFTHRLVLSVALLPSSLSLSFFLSLSLSLLLAVYPSLEKTLNLFMISASVCHVVHCRIFVLCFCLTKYLSSHKAIKPVLFFSLCIKGPISLPLILIISPYQWFHHNLIAIIY